MLFFFHFPVHSRIKPPYSSDPIWFVLFAMRFLSASLITLLSLHFAHPLTAADSTDHADLEGPEHRYWETHPGDRFTRLADEWQAGQNLPPLGDPLKTLQHLLDTLDIPVSSQLLVFSATSLQSGRITVNNPRAIYFNDDTSVGYVPGGKIEILSIDPQLGAIFYIVELPNTGRSPIVDRSTRCMNCHSGERVHHVPSHAIESVIPSITGGTLEAYRRGIFGHSVPLEDRLGGWHVTGEGAIKKHRGNVIGKLSPAGLKLTRYIPGEAFSWNNYLTKTSDMLAHLIHEHQIGFINLVVEATYRTRHALHQSNGNLTPEQQQTIDQLAQQVVRYTLFADEVPLPPGGVPGDPEYKAAFQKHNRHALPNNGPSLRDLDLRNRMFRYRCSYMVHTPLWQGMPAPLKQRVDHHLAAALDPNRPHPDYSYLSSVEKQTIRAILNHSGVLKFQ